MAAKRPISVTITGDYNDRDINRAIRDLNSLKRQAGGTTPVMGGLGKAMVGMMGAFAVGALISNVTDFLKGAAEAAMADEASVKKLETAMRNLNASGDLPAVEQGIAKLSRAVGVADDELRPAFQRLMQATNDTETAQSALSTALDISAGTGKDLNSVTLALSKAYMGNAAGLKRLGVPLDDTLVKSKDMTAIQAELNRVFGGQAAAAANSYSGQIKKIGVAADEAKEAIGYALLQSVEDVSNAIGGAGGVTGAIDDFGVGAAGLVRGIGELVAGITGLVANLRKTEDQTSETGSTFRGFIQLIPIAGTWLSLLADRGMESNEVTKEMNDSLRASESYMRMYVASIDPAAAATAKYALEAEDAAEQTRAVEEAFSDMTLAMASVTAMDNFRQALNDINEELKDGKTDITGYTDTAIANKALILGVFDDAKDAAIAWKNETGASTDEMLAMYERLATQARQKLINNGINEQDLDAFLGDNEMWSKKIKSLFGAAVRLSKDKVYTAGLSIGVEFADGVTKGIIIGTPSASTAAIDLVDGLPGGKRNKKANKNQFDTGYGLIKNLFDGVDAASKTLRKDLMTNFRDWFSDTAGKLQDALGEAQDNYDKWYDEFVVPLEKTLEDAQKKLDDFKDGVKNTITGMVNFGDLKPTAAVFGEDGALETAATTFLGNLAAQKEKIVKFTDQIKRLIAMGLNEQSIQQILSAGADAGGAIATELIDGGVTAINETNALMDSINTAADSVAVDGAAKWYQSGVDLAQAQLDGYLANNKPTQDAILAAAQKAYDDFMRDYGPGGTKRDQVINMIDDIVADAQKKAILKLDLKVRKKKIKEQINQLFREAGVREKDLPFQGVLDDPDERAMGGLVGRGRPYIVGERGPELFVPSDSGTIVPNHALGSGGSVTNVYVTAGMGADGGEIGRQVVEAISKYERRSGRVYARV